MADEYALDAEKAAKRARNAAALVLIAAAVIAIVVYIDIEIKKSVLAQALKARDLLDEARKLAEEAKHGGQAPSGQAGSAAGAGIDHGNGVVRHAAAGEVLDQASGSPQPARPRVKARPANRAPGDE